MMRVLRDASFSAIIAGFVTVLVGFTSSAVIVFQAAHALGATQEEIGSWMCALGLGMGATCILLSLRYRVPVVTAWSTPGAAMLVAGTAGASMAQAVGAFLVSAALIVLVGFTGAFERAIKKIPTSIAAGMLAGVLLRFGLDVFVALKTQFVLVFAMFCAYLLLRRLLPRYAVVGALALGLIIAACRGLLHMEGLHLQVAALVWRTPEFSLTALIGLALPLFVVTMASQNVQDVPPAGSLISTSA